MSRENKILTAVAVAGVLKQYLPDAGRQELIVAYSGGRDSQVLLHVMVALAASVGIRVRGAHFNHGLHPEAEHWQAFCQRWCAAWGVPFHYGAAHRERYRGTSVEAEARRQRYRWLASIATAGQVVVTAHHADDQAETFLHHLLQGKGPAQLAGILPVRNIDHGCPIKLVRPLLGWRGAAIQHYAETHHLRWIDDPTNRDRRYRRNFIRHDLLPRLRARNPDIDADLNRGAMACQRIRAREQTLFDDLITQASRPAMEDVLCEAAPLEYHHFSNHGEWVFAGVVRIWLHRVGLPSPGAAKLTQLFHLVSKTPAAACMDWHSHRIWIHHQHLYLTRNLTHEPRPERPLPSASPIILNDYLALRLRPVTTGIAPALAHEPETRLRWRQGGEKLQRRGRTHRSCVKKLYQAAKTPPWVRDWLPYLVIGDEVIWVPGIGINDQFRAAPDQPAILPELYRYRETEAG